MEWLVELGMIEGVGNGKARHYILSSKVYALSGNETGYTRQKGMTTMQEKSLIERHVEQFGKITRAKTAELCKCDENHAYYLLRLMTREGMLKAEKSGRYAYYIKA